MIDYGRVQAYLQSKKKKEKASKVTVPPAPDVFSINDFDKWEDAMGEEGFWAEPGLNMWCGDLSACTVPYLLCGGPGTVGYDKYLAELAAEGDFPNIGISLYVTCVDSGVGASHFEFYFSVEPALHDANDVSDRKIAAANSRTYTFRVCEEGLFVEPFPRFPWVIDRLITKAGIDTPVKAAKMAKRIFRIHMDEILRELEIPEVPDAVLASVPDTWIPSLEEASKWEKAVASLNYYAPRGKTEETIGWCAASKFADDEDAVSRVGFALRFGWRGDMRRFVFSYAFCGRDYTCAPTIWSDDIILPAEIDNPVKAAKAAKEGVRSHILEGLWYLDGY